MGHHERIDAMFARVHTRLPAAAVPGFVGSPMDDRATVTVLRAVIDACDRAEVVADRAHDWIAEHLDATRRPGRAEAG